ncbi:GNAT family N-acetyltransferase [Nostocoides sp. HKS02]|uniref:GNAT family N-acetyltransferase n=1 Tax=Nostocoides sp. HKS02 TaxID=1813880 RepID=UPI0012B4B7DE|nr:GNAT family N-acetyltransferase [Tetrasphaera sp. HKS02]QGN57087.1 GNAT family N-acetyltransferase [Tetrasphaera sp. HKS02]
MTLRQLRSHAEVLDASGGDAFIRYDLPTALEHPGWALGRAVVVTRRTHTRRLGLLVLGPPADVDALSAHLVREALLPPGVGAVTVAHDALAAVAAHLPLADGNDWEWMYAVSPPPLVAAESRLVALGPDDLGDLQDLLGSANPRTDARPFAYPGQVWVGVRTDSGRLVACGVREPSLAGYPILSGITVDPAHRGTGLGLAVTAYLTRAAVAQAGVCTLGMYSDNDVARRVYRGLGYRGDHRWASRRLAPGPSPA